MTSDDHAGPREIPATMRVARPPSDLIRTREFYEQLVGLAVLGEFADHDGYDSVIFGVPDERAQLEIVDPPHAIVPQPTVEDALVLYLTPESKTEIGQRPVVARISSRSVRMPMSWNGSLVSQVCQSSAPNNSYSSTRT